MKELYFLYLIFGIVMGVSTFYHAPKFPMLNKHKYFGTVISAVFWPFWLIMLFLIAKGLQTEKFGDKLYQFIMEV